MIMQKDEVLYDTWDKHWAKERKLTPVGRIFCPIRMKALRRTFQELDINTAIDVGCGFGYLLEIFHESGLDYVGLDVAPRSIEVCKHMGLNARLGKVEDETQQYDLVAAEGMLEHFVNFEPFAKHMMRISKRYVLIMQPNHDSFTGRTLAYVTQTLRGSNIVLEYNYQIKDFISVFERNGFSAIKNEPLILNTSRLILFEKK